MERETEYRKKDFGEKTMSSVLSFFEFQVPDGHLVHVNSGTQLDNARGVMQAKEKESHKRKTIIISIASGK